MEKLTRTPLLLNFCKAELLDQIEILVIFFKYKLCSCKLIFQNRRAKNIAN